MRIKLFVLELRQQVLNLRMILSIFFGLFESWIFCQFSSLKVRPGEAVWFGLGISPLIPTTDKVDKDTLLLATMPMLKIYVLQLTCYRQHHYVEYTCSMCPALRCRHYCGHCGSICTASSVLVSSLISWSRTHYVMWRLKLLPSVYQSLSKFIQTSLKRRGFILF